jgi:hypothetical protein
VVIRLLGLAIGAAIQVMAGIIIMMMMVAAVDGMADEILATFKSLGFDRAHIEDKRHSLTGEDRLAVFL